MDVRRLLARLRGSVAALLPRRHAHASPASAVVAASATGALPASVAAPALRRMSIASWLEDGRRLRPRSALSGKSGSDGRPDASSSPGGLRRPRSGIPTAPGRLTPHLGPGAANLTTSEGAAHVLASTSPALTPSPSALPPDILVDFSGELSAATLAAIEGMDSTQRRLIFLRYLVRQGIYNEGFGERILPEQYWRSRGVDGPLSQQ
jgi:hypothetical protein